MSKIFTALIVDDHADFRLLLTKRLTKLGIKVRQAQDVVEAFANLAKDGPADLIISDYKMPGASGTEFLEALRESKFTMPFILVSAEIALPSAEVKQRGIAAFLRKPFSSEELENAIKPYFSKA